MAKNRSEASGWPSKYSPGEWVSDHQYIIELVCEARARKDKKDLPLRFWNIPEWKKLFVAQTRATTRLLKKYSSKAILNAIRHRGIYSLAPKWVENVISQEQRKLDAAKSKAKADVSSMPKEQQKTIIDKGKRPDRSTKIDKLLNLDDEE